MVVLFKMIKHNNKVGQRCAKQQIVIVLDNGCISFFHGGPLPDFDMVLSFCKSCRFSTCQSLLLKSYKCYKESAADFQLLRLSSMEVIFQNFLGLYLNSFTNVRKHILMIYVGVLINNNCKFLVRGLLAIYSFVIVSSICIAKNFKNKSEDNN